MDCFCFSAEICKEIFIQMETIFLKRDDSSVKDIPLKEYFVKAQHGCRGFICSGIFVNLTAAFIIK